MKRFAQTTLGVGALAFGAAFPVPAIVIGGVVTGCIIGRVISNYYAKEPQT